MCTISLSYCPWQSFPAKSDLTLKVIGPICKLRRKWCVVNTLTDAQAWVKVTDVASKFQIKWKHFVPSHRKALKLDWSFNTKKSGKLLGIYFTIFCHSANVSGYSSLYYKINYKKMMLATLNWIYYWWYFCCSLLITIIN